jgi:hypothetical protein
MAYDPEHVRQTLAKWDDFPVHREPRPIVLVDLGPQALDRLAAEMRSRRVFDAPAVAESELPAELVPAAIDYCRNVHTGAQQPLAPIIRAPGPFGTDRGMRELPAWMMFPENRRWPFIALDPQFEREMTWRPAGVLYGDLEESTLTDDGHMLTYRFIGTPFIYADYPSAEVYETGTAVLVEPVAVDHHPGQTVRLAYMEEREVVVHLAAPLGNRVLVSPPHGPEDHYGGPRPVILGRPRPM